MITPIKKIITKAKKEKYAVGAFNTSNLEITLAIIRAAVKMKSPVIIQTSESAIKYSNLQTIFGIMTNVANTVGKSVPIAIHLDHGKHKDIVRDCVNIGYNSVHMDASEKDYATNVKWSAEAARWAHKKGIWIQAELGAILGKEGMVKLSKGLLNMEDMMTDPDKAQDFINKTKVDTLAISVGTIHGSFKGVEKVDQARLKRIASAIPKTPLVLHGGSGLSPAVFKKAIANGVSVVNIDTNLRLAWKKAMGKSIVKADKSGMIDPRKILNPGTDAIQAEVERIIKIFGSKDKA